MNSKLIIGNLNSPYVKGLVENLKKDDPLLRVDCLSTSYPRVEVEGIDKVYYNLCSYVWVKLFKKYGGFAWYIGVLGWYLFRRERIRYDSIQIHYVDPLHLLPFNLYKLSAKKVAAITWGSDIFRSVNVTKLTSILSKSDAINVSTPEMRAKVASLIGEYSLNTKEVTDCKFGLTPLSVLRDLKTKNLSRSDLLELLGLACAGDKKIVVVGSNAAVEQQHIEIIQSLSEHDVSNSFFIFPMTYGGNPDYLQMIKDSLSASSLDYSVVCNYLSDEQNAALKMVSDYFIQLQTTDALSGATQENLFANTSVIVGDWLPYGTFIDAGIQYTTVSKVSDIGKTLTQLLEADAPDKKVLEMNSDIIWNLSSWQSVVSQWKQI